MVTNLGSGPLVDPGVNLCHNVSKTTKDAISVTQILTFNQFMSITPDSFLKVKLIRTVYSQYFKMWQEVASKYYCLICHNPKTLG